MWVVIELVVGELVASSVAFRLHMWLVGVQQIMQPCCKQRKISEADSLRFQQHGLREVSGSVNKDLGR